MNARRRPAPPATRADNIASLRQLPGGGERGPHTFELRMRHAPELLASQDDLAHSSVGYRVCLVLSAAVAKRFTSHLREVRVGVCLCVGSRGARTLRWDTACCSLPM